MKALFKRANLPQEVVDGIEDVVRACKQCRLWDRLPAKNVAKTILATTFNQRVWLDLLFSTVFCGGTPRDCTNLHLLDEATVVCMLPLILGRTFAAIRMGIFRWTEPWGFPEEFLADGEKGISSGEMKAWLATNNSTLLPIPPAKGSRHTQFGVVDTHSRAIRGVIHRVDASLVERKV